MKKTQDTKMKKDKKKNSVNDSKTNNKDEAVKELDDDLDDDLNDDLDDDVDDDEDDDLDDDFDDDEDDEEEDLDDDYDDDDEYDEEDEDSDGDEMYCDADGVRVHKNAAEKKIDAKDRHSGYVALIGRTNVGKSTFLNAIMETKVSIVSNKPQTTRKQILGIKTSERGQIIFFDSPGIHKPYFKLNEKMMQDVHSSLMDADIILYFIDVDTVRKDEFALSLFQNAEKPVFLIINKIDKYHKSKVLEKIAFFKDIYPWREIVPISALKNLNISLMEDLLFQYLPENDYFYPDEEFTLQSERFYVSEIVREKILQTSRQEIPFTTMVQVEEITEKETVVYIRAEIYVESHSQKKILVGKHGSFVKTVGELARKDLEDYFDQKVYLDLYIKIVPNWRNSTHVLSIAD